MFSPYACQRSRGCQSIWWRGIGAVRYVVLQQLQRGQLRGLQLGRGVQCPLTPRSATSLGALGIREVRRPSRTGPNSPLRRLTGQMCKWRLSDRRRRGAQRQQNQWDGGNSTAHGGIRAAIVQSSCPACIARFILTRADRRRSRRRRARPGGLLRRFTVSTRINQGLMWTAIVAAMAVTPALTLAQREGGAAPGAQGAPAGGGARGGGRGARRISRRPARRRACRMASRISAVIGTTRTRPTWRRAASCSIRRRACPCSSRAWARR